MLLLVTVVTVVATVLGRSGKETEKAVKITIAAMTQTVAALGEREQSPKVSPLPTTIQSETCFPIQLATKP